VLLRFGVPLLPRMMAEHAHRATGVDIHPGARIGPGLFIDHGTGVVIGETAVIGTGVRLYQGVTLGALSLPAHKVAELRAGAKRHPTLEDDVVVYAGATILGGQTVGRGSVIGGSAWVVESVPPGSRVFVESNTKIKLGPRSHATRFGSPTSTTESLHR
jgi:serine O-acetyltransferase